MDENILNNFNERTRALLNNRLRRFSNRRSGRFGGSDFIGSERSFTRASFSIYRQRAARTRFVWKRDGDCFVRRRDAFCGGVFNRGNLFFRQPQISVLVRQSLASGAIYGILVYFVMQLIVKQTLAPPLPFSIFGLVQVIIIHILFVGLPTAIIIRCFANKFWLKNNDSMVLPTVKSLRARAISHSLFRPTTLKNAVERLKFVQADPLFDILNYQFNYQFESSFDANCMINWN